MGTGPGHNQVDETPVVFAAEDESQSMGTPAFANRAWKILIVDDEQEVHDITRITLKGFGFKDRGVELLSAFSGQEAKEILQRESDLAMILLDVVMEEDDTGLRLVEYIRGQLENHAVRIVLRTGQPGMAPEHQVISQYDINDYKTKPEFTAQKLYTSVISCLRAYENLKTIERNREGLESIIQSSSVIFQNKSLDAFGDRVLNQLKELLKLDWGKDSSGGYFVGLPQDRVRLVSGRGVCEGFEGKPVEQALSSDALDHYTALFKTGGDEFFNDAFIEVFRSKDGFVSALYLKTSHPLSSEERNLLRIFANNIAIGFNNISLAREIINTQKEVILTLGEVVETRSQETAHHVTRVAEVCYLLARKCGLSREKARLLRLASPMHDVGKIGIPEAILNKPGRLTSEEFEVIKTHARIGYEILGKSQRPIMKAAAITAFEHHERWDGNGYPRGLKGDEIHIFGRIAAIADVFDALSHKRCYKEAWPMEKIVAIFKKDAGKHFDPKLAALFLAHLDEFEAINKKFPE